MRIKCPECELPVELKLKRKKMPEGSDPAFVDMWVAEPHIRRDVFLDCDIADNHPGLDERVDAELKRASAEREAENFISSFTYRYTGEGTRTRMFDEFAAGHCAWWEIISPYTRNRVVTALYMPTLRFLCSPELWAYVLAQRVGELTGRVDESESTEDF